MRLRHIPGVAERLTSPAGTGCHRMGTRSALWSEAPAGTIMSTVLFTPNHRSELSTRGFTRIQAVISADATTAFLSALPEVSVIDYENALTWYRLSEDYPGIIPSHHHQSQWNLRQDVNLHRVFSELWGTSALWVTMDRIGFVPPLRAGEVETCQLHWDMAPRGPSVYQGIVYLTDVTADRAPFTAAPRIFENLADWLAAQPEGFDFSEVDFSNEPTVAVEGKAGDLIIWSSKLPHGPGANHASQPRVMQAVSMFPPANADWTREEQIGWWQTKRAPPWWRDVPGQADPEPGPPATLTEHGQRLVGLKSW